MSNFCVVCGSDNFENDFLNIICKGCGKKYPFSYFGGNDPKKESEEKETSLINLVLNIHNEIDNDYGMRLLLVSIFITFILTIVISVLLVVYVLSVVAGVIFAFVSFFTLFSIPYKIFVRHYNGCKQRAKNIAQRIRETGLINK